MDDYIIKPLNLILAALLCGAGLVMGYGDGAKPGSTNGPGETSCQDANCHTYNVVDPSRGSVKILGLPRVFVPGEYYSLRVVLQQYGQRRWGFQITALDDYNRPAGELLVTDAVRTRKTLGGETSPRPRQYIEHSRAGSYMGFEDGPVEWTFDWRAPETNDVNKVFFYVAANAANFDKNTWGDYIHTKTKSLKMANPD